MKREKGFTRHNQNYWEAQISTWQSSGLNMSEYCRQNNLNHRSLSNWKRKLNQTGLKTCSQPFVEIKCYDESLEHSDQTIEMTIGTTRFIMREGIDPLVLRDIALALGVI